MQEPVFVSELPPHGKTGVRSPGSGRPGVPRSAFTKPTARQPNRGLTDDDPEFTCSVCRQVLPMEEAHRVKTKEGPYRRTGRCIPCALVKQREANDQQYLKRMGGPPPVPKDQLFPVVDGKRQCALCGETKSIEHFYADTSVASGFVSVCKACYQDRRRIAYLLRMYQLSLDRYLEMLAAQGGVCAICKRPETSKRQSERPALLSVDHDHACCPGKKSCGKCVRQLLCHYCNVTVGFIERVGSVDPFAAYLAHHARG